MPLGCCSDGDVQKNNEILEPTGNNSQSKESIEKESNEVEELSRWSTDSTGGEQILSSPIQIKPLVIIRPRFNSGLFQRS